MRSRAERSNAATLHAERYLHEGFRRGFAWLVASAVSFALAFACGEPAGTSRALDAGAPESVDERPWFSFFTTSMTGLLGLAPDPERGFGGDLGGLEGADDICRTLALSGNPTDTKIWRAFLSSSGARSGARVDAIDRVGDGPWYDWHGRRLASDRAGLVPLEEDGRPAGEPQLVEMFTDEHGAPIRENELTDNHDVLTGSGPDGTLFDDGAGGDIASCGDWTDASLRGEVGDFMGNGGQVPVGHSWPRSDRSGRHWISDHTVNGCEAGIDVIGVGAAPSDDFSVGGGGGYGGFYCFALGAVAPFEK